MPNLATMMSLNFMANRRLSHSPIFSLKSQDSGFSDSEVKSKNSTSSSSTSSDDEPPLTPSDVVKSVKDKNSVRSVEETPKSTKDKNVRSAVNLESVRSAKDTLNETAANVSSLQEGLRLKQRQFEERERDPTNPAYKKSSPNFLLVNESTLEVKRVTRLYTNPTRISLNLVTLF